MNVASQLLSRARQFPSAPSITADGQTTTFAELADRVAHIAGSLTQSLGVGTGDRVLLYLENCREYIEIMFASWAAGACVVPVNAKLHGKEVAHIRNDSGAQVVFTSESLAPNLSQLLEAPTVEVVIVGTKPYEALVCGPAMACREVEPADSAWIFYTSGTTGFPKGAVLSHRNLLFMALCYYADIERVQPGTTMLHAAALSHGCGLYLLPHLLAGGHQVLFRKFDPIAILEAFATHPAVSMFAVPTIFNRLVQAAGNASGSENLRTIIYGGAPMYVSDLLKALDAFGPRFFQLYGQGETPMTITGLGHRDHQGSRDPAHLARLASCGVPRTGVEVRVVDENGRDCPVGNAGEVIVRSDCTMSGYWNNPAATAAALRDGWLWTGDIGSVDASGYLFLRDRSKDMVISGGSNIYPREIEEVLLLHPAVAECSVVGRPHHDLGEEPIAFVVCREGMTVTAEELDQQCLMHIARFKRPRDYKFLDSLPKSSYGKILKADLRHLLQENHN